MARALIVDESLKCDLPEEWGGRLIRSRSHKLRTLGNVTISEYLFNEREMAFASSVLTSCLKEPRYYAHLVSEEVMLICYPGIVVTLARRSPQAEFERCRAVGNMFEIPSDEMKFEKMFDEDHPDKE